MFATIKQSSVDPEDFSVEWGGDSSVGMYGQSEARMWAAHMNEAFEKGKAEATMPASLEDKLAVMIWYLEQRRVSRISDDARAFDSYLDDPEIMNWLDRMKKTNRIVNTRFTDKGR